MKFGIFKWVYTQLVVTFFGFGHRLLFRHFKSSLFLLRFFNSKLFLWICHLWNCILIFNETGLGNLLLFVSWSLMCWAFTQEFEVFVFFTLNVFIAHHNTPLGIKLPFYFLEAPNLWVSHEALRCIATAVKVERLLKLKSERQSGFTFGLVVERCLQFRKHMHLHLVLIILVAHRRVLCCQSWVNATPRANLD